MTDNEVGWWLQSVVYHIYPLGYCGAPRENDLAAEPVPRLRQITVRLESIREMGFTCLYLGPVFESTSHGYDTADYERVDRRLGTDEDLRTLVDHAHEVGMRVVLDGVFNHVGRDFWAFTDLRRHGRKSPYVSWFHDVDFTAENRCGDGFSYRDWEGADTLVALNHDEPAVVEHLVHAVERMLVEYDIDGLRLDVAYLLPRSFVEALRRAVDAMKPEFLLLGEVIHGDYSSYLDDGPLDSVTNYQGYKALWSSHNDRNYFELAHTFERLGRCDDDAAGAPSLASRMCAFVDNHDVDRIASKLREPGHLFPIHALLFTLPGVPAVYYGSEWAHRGRKSDGDEALRPTIREIERRVHRAGSDTGTTAGALSAATRYDEEYLVSGKGRGCVATAERDRDDNGSRAFSLNRFVRELAALRARSEALWRGSLRVVHLSATQLAFLRQLAAQSVLILVNAEDRTVRLPSLSDDVSGGGRCLFSGSSVDLEAEKHDGGVVIPAFGTRIVELDPSA